MAIKVRYTDTCAFMDALEFDGVYNGVVWHDPDIKSVLKRAWNEGVKRVIVPGNTLRMSRRVLSIVKEEEPLFATVACNPYWTSIFDFGLERNKSKLINMCLKGQKVIGIGRTGLDFSINELDAAPKEVQIAYFKMHLEVCNELNLPILLRCHNAVNEMVEALQKYEGTIKGVVHTFDGSIADAEAFQKLGLYIGITPCSLRKEKDAEVVKAIPLKRLLLGTNCPRCKIKQFFYGYEHIKTKFPEVNKDDWNKETMVKGRNEPLLIKQLVEAVAGLRGLKPELLALLNEANTNMLFFSSQPPLPEGATPLPIDRSKLIYLDESRIKTITQFKPQYLN